MLIGSVIQQLLIHVQMIACTVTLSHIMALLVPHSEHVLLSLLIEVKVISDLHVI